jgi:hypothetical protein
MGAHETALARLALDYVTDCAKRRVKAAKAASDSKDASNEWLAALDQARAADAAIINQRGK